MNLLHTLFGDGKELTLLQITLRSISMFFIALVLIKLAGMRTFGQKSSFDAIVVIMLGALLSRGVMGVTPFIHTVAAGTALCAFHRLVAIVSVFNTTVGYFAKGRSMILYGNGQFNRRNMIICSISYKDLAEEVRLNLSENHMDNVDEIYMERSGRISIIKKK